MTNSQRPRASILSILLITGLFGALAFATGIAVWRFTPVQTMDIFVVEPLADQPAQQNLEATSNIETQTPIANESATNNHPTLPIEPVMDPELIEEAPPTSAAKPGFLEQSTMGWKIIIGAISSSLSN